MKQIPEELLPVPGITIETWSQECAAHSGEKEPDKVGDGCRRVGEEMHHLTQPQISLHHSSPRKSPSDDILTLNPCEESFCTPEPLALLLTLSNSTVITACLPVTSSLPHCELLGGKDPFSCLLKVQCLTR